MLSNTNTAKLERPSVIHPKNAPAQLSGNPEKDSKYMPPKSGKTVKALSEPNWPVRPTRAYTFLATSKREEIEKKTFEKIQDEKLRQEKIRFYDQSQVRETALRRSVEESQKHKSRLSAKREAASDGRTSTDSTDAFLLDRDEFHDLSPASHRYNTRAKGNV